MINPSAFDWLSFFWGGTAGSLIILGIERIFDYFWKKIEKEEDESKTTQAFFTEARYNIEICDVIIDRLSNAHHAVYNFAKFNTLWLDRYCDQHIDFGNDESRVLYSYFYGAKSLMMQIEDIQSNQHLLSSSGRALGSFKILAHNNNQAVLNHAKGVKTILELIEKIKTGNKTTKELVDKFIPPSIVREFASDQV
jgi:hypothetical protein